MNETHKDDDIENFLSTITYTPSICDENSSEFVEQIKDYDTQSIRDKLTNKNFQYPGCVEIENDCFYDRKYLKIKLNLTKTNDTNISSIDEIRTDIVEKFELDPTHDYSKYTAVSRYENFLN